MVSNLVFAKTTIFLCFFFFSIIDLQFLISAVIAQIFIPTAELAMPAGIPTTEVN